MKIFLDANILIAVCNKEYPLFPFAARILSLVDKREHQLYTSPLCLAICYYFAEKKTGHTKAKQKMILLAEKIKLTDHTPEDVKQVAQNKKIHDFEDGLEYYSAIRHKCDVIITEDIDDFYFSDLPILSAKMFLKDLLK
ncbi:MAG: PIN domain-containing protein [Chitinophagaceae bacterium]|nr:PIN domain-containing protein [Chitinophagaceae bacterium]